jgi:hypothetical protein
MLTVFNSNFPEFVALDLIFYKVDNQKKKPWEKGWFSQQIANHAQGEHSHVEFKFTFADGTVWCFSSSEQDGGSRFKEGKKVLKNPDRWNKIRVTIDPLLIGNVWNFCVEQEGKRYDWWGVLRFKLSFIKENPKTWYCSEVTQAALHRIGLFPRLYSIHPEDMFRIARFIFKKKEEV